MNIFKLIVQVIIIAVVCWIIYWVGWFLFAFGTSTYDTVTDSDDGTDYYWETYKNN